MAPVEVVKITGQARASLCAPRLRHLATFASREERANFVPTLWLPTLAISPVMPRQLPPARPVTLGTGEATGEATAEAATQLPAEVQKMLKVLAEPSTRQVIMQLLDLRHEAHFRTAYVAPAPRAQVVEL